MSAHPFKAGDRIRPVSDRSTDIAEGDEFVVLGVDFGTSGSPRVQFNDKGGDFRHRLAEDYELVAGKKRDYVADHARRTLRKAGLSKQDAALFVKNLQEQNPTAVSLYSRNVPASFCAGALDGFLWSDSPQGHGYWAERLDAFDNKVRKEFYAQA